MAKATHLTDSEIARIDTLCANPPKVTDYVLSSIAVLKTKAKELK